MKPDDVKDHQVTTLNCPPDFEFISGILFKLSISDRVDICRKLNLAIPGIWPLISRKHGNAKLPTDFSMFFPQDNMLVMREYCKQKLHLILPKHVFIICNDRKIYIGSDNTKPAQSTLMKANLVLLERENYFNISLKSYLNIDPAVQEEENLPTDESDTGEVSREVLSQLNDVQSYDVTNAQNSKTSTTMDASCTGNDTFSSTNAPTDVPACIDSSNDNSMNCSNANSRNNQDTCPENDIDHSAKGKDETIQNFLRENETEAHNDKM